MTHTARISILLGLAVLFAPQWTDAQPATLEWEQVGQPIESNDIAFADNGTLWSVGDDVFKLDKGDVEWTFVSDQFLQFILPLQPDTLLGSIEGGGIGLSLDGGETWPAVFDEGGKLFASDLGGPNDGVLLTGILDSTGVGYSHDRGATWHRADGLETSSLFHVCESFHEITRGPFTGRLIAGCVGGMAYSDDRGENWSLSNIWVDFTYECKSIITAQNGVLYAHIRDPDPGYGLWTSTDGATWARTSTLPTDAHLIGVPGGPVAAGIFYAVGKDGEFHRSLDAGLSWEELARMYEGIEDFDVNAVILAPDDRIYAGVTAAGPGPQSYWGVYRTTEPVVVVNEPEIPQPPTAERLAIYPNPATASITVEGVAPGDEVVLYDVLGRVVLRSRGRSEIDVSSLPAGVFVVRVGDASRVVTIRR